MADDLNRKKRKEAMRVLKFVLFSASAGIIEIGVFTLMEVATDFPYWPCYLTALICSVLWNFTMNRHFTFQSANNVPVAMMKVAAYYCVFTPVTTIGGNYLAETLGFSGDGPQYGMQYRDGIPVPEILRVRQNDRYEQTGAKDRGKRSREKSRYDGTGVNHAYLRTRISIRNGDRHEADAGL